LKKWLPQIRVIKADGLQEEFEKMIKGVSKIIPLF